MSQIDHTHNTPPLKPAAVKSLKFVLLLVLNWAVVTALVGFGMGVANSDAPTVVALSFVAAVVWITPFNYVATRTLL